MKIIKYLIQFIIICVFYVIFKIIGVKLSSFLSGKLFEIIGPIFRSKKIVNNNIKKAFPDYNSKELNKIKSSMWNNYGRVFAEYIFIKEFRFGKLSQNIRIEGQEILEQIKKENNQVIFVSAHFSNFELMAMAIEKAGVNLSAVYRPLNNKMVNSIMEPLRKKYICKNQIKKGINGVRESLINFKQGVSVAIMIDQRVSEGEKINFFSYPAYTTTIPAQFAKKFGCKIQPVHIERYDKINFKITFDKPIVIEENDNNASISLKLNQWLENKIRKNPSQWIWTHNRWK